MNERKKAWSNFLAALCLTCCLLSGAVVLTLFFRPLYYFDIGALDIPALSGLTEAEIRLNYDTLIDYNFLFFRGALQFPTLPMSETGRIHFEEVKVIFDAVQALFLVTLCAGTAFCLYKRKRKEYGYLKIAALLSVGLPLVLGGLIALNWEAFFVGFHKVFFRNDYWVFDVRSDPVIAILPDAFFMHCAVMILLLVVLGSILFFVIYRILKRRRTVPVLA